MLESRSKAMRPSGRIDYLIRIAAVCFALLLFSSTAFAVFAEPENNWSYDADGDRVAMPIAYSAEKTVDYFGEGVGSLSNAQDLFYKNGKLYVADSKNNRVLVLNMDMECELVIHGDSLLFNNPQGVFASENGDIYVADTNNGRIVHFDSSGNPLQAYSQPYSELYDVSYVFKPVKLCINSVGQFFIINFEDYHGFIVMDKTGEFKGYVAPTKVESSLLDKLVEFLATEEQKEQLEQKLPPVHTNCFMDGSGAVYVTTSRTTVEQLQKFLSYGSNIFPYTGSFGTGLDNSQITDVSVSKDGIITLLESDSGLIYQYDPNGTMICSFGGAGNWKGTFMSASSICEDEDGNFYVLDAGTDTITVWKPTSFIRKVHSALGLLNEGQYSESMILWEDVLKIDRNYFVARVGMGKAYMRLKEYDKAIEQYKIADYKAGYSDAYAQLRRKFFREHFGLVVAAVLLLFVGIYELVHLTRRYARRLAKKM